MANAMPFVEAGVFVVRSSAGVFLFLGLGLVLGCAELPQAAESPVLTVGCRVNVTGEDTAVVNWELTVDPEPIEADESFTATLGGYVVVQEAVLDAGQEFYPGGIEEIDLVELNATVHVRSGATGPDVTLTVDPDVVEYQCERLRTACDPANDVFDDPPKPPGLRANTDCEPVGPTNPCGRFLRLPLSTDCAPGGVCADRGKTGPGSQCAMNGFCLTGDFRIALREETAQYTAASDGPVLFGWADESTEAMIKEDEPNKGTWILPEPVYSEPAGPIGMRLTVGGIPTAFECTMGVNCSDPVLGVDCSDTSLSSRTPDEALVSFPIDAGGV
jgi:hypothetical protein